MVSIRFPRMAEILHIVNIKITQDVKDNKSVLLVSSVSIVLGLKDVKLKKGR